MSQSPAPDPGPLPSEDLQLRVDFFRKLGYSTADVEAAFQKLQLDTDTNAVLGELVRVGARVSGSDHEERSAGFRSSLLPPSWTSTPAKSKGETAQRKSTDEELRTIVIDGSNVAMSHGNKTIFSCRGIQLAVNFFLDRGHDKIKVFVPSWRKEQPRPDAPIRDQHILTELEKRGLLVFTPSRHVGGKRVVCYDDRFIVKVASESEGVIVSNDTYRDLQGENAEWKKCIEERLLMYSFVNDKFMPPDDPLGRHGPTLDNFLRRKPLLPEQTRQRCPYDKKCTYGIKCRFYHPERTNQPYISVADALREKAQTSSHEPGSRSPPKSSLTKTDSPKASQLSENVLLYREAPGSSQNHLQASVERGAGEWAGLHPLPPSHHYGSGSQEYLDSGLGSYDSLNNSLWPWPQQQSNNMTASQCPSFALQTSANTEQHKYGSYPYSSTANTVHHSVSHKGSFPGLLQYSSAPHPDHRYSSAPPPEQRYSSAPPPDHRYQSAPPPVDQRFWSYPAAPAKASLPVMLQHSAPYSDPRFNPWAQTPPTFVPGDPRMELRSKLQAIFNPADVDRAMEMFPTVTDSEKLAEEIVKLKRGIF